MTSHMPPQQPWGPVQPPPQQQPWGPVQPPPRPPRNKHTFRNIMLSLSGLLAVLIIALAAMSGGGAGNAASSDATATSSGSGGQAAAAAPASPAHHHKTITYVVTGSSAEITYGPAGSDLNGEVPMHVTRKLHSKAYYAISAQVQGGGSVHCAIKVNGKTISKATATGSYNIADCEITQNPLTGKWEDTNSG